MSDFHICGKCEQLCEVVSIDAGGYEEWWGSKVWHEQLEDVSECCHDDAHTPEEWRENHWDTPKSWELVDLIEHGFTAKENNVGSQTS